MSPLAIIFLCIGAVVVIILVSMYFSYNNREIALRKQAEAQKGKIKAVRDTMFKVLQEKAGVAANYRDAFEKIYPEIISGRYSHGDGRLAQWIQEQNPQFDTSLYASLQDTIQVERQAFLTAQSMMLDIINMRGALIEQYPSRWFISNKSDIPYTVIASDDTNNVVSSGVDNWQLKM